MARKSNNQDDQSENINEKVFAEPMKLFPLSHGTHVSSITLQDVDNIGFAGYYSQS